MPSPSTRTCRPSPRRAHEHHAAIYRTSIAHVRRTPLKNAFTYRSYSWYVDVDRLPEVPRLLRPLAGFSVADHLGDPDGTLRGNVEAFLRHPGDNASTAAGSPCWPAPGCSGTSSTR